ncbi:MAG TPA: hypothetical protein VF453_14945, partial [Burkholderiaceae bacterium]
AVDRAAGELADDDAPGEPPAGEPAMPGHVESEARPPCAGRDDDGAVDLDVDLDDGAGREVESRLAGELAH